MNEIIKKQQYPVIYKKYLDQTTYLELRKLPEQHYRGKKIYGNSAEYLAERDKLLMDMLWQTGIRVGDLVTIRKENFDFKRKIVWFNIKKSKVKNHFAVIFDDLLRDIMTFYMKWDKEPFDMRRENVNKIMKRYGKMADIKLTPHMFRHGYIQFMELNGVPSWVTQKLVGHKKLETTNKHYRTITPQLAFIHLKDIQWRG